MIIHFNSFFQILFELPPFMSKYLNTADGQKDADVGVRGQNKVSALAKDLAIKFSGEKKPTEELPRQVRVEHIKVYFTFICMHFS